MWKDALWLGVPREEIEEKKIYHGDMNGRFAYYRLCLNLDNPVELVADISANSRYRLWINEKPVLSGPCRSNRERQYYETVSLRKYLKAGKNVLAVQVLLCDSMYVKSGPGDTRAPLNSVETVPAGHRLAMEGAVKDAEGNEIAVVTTGKADWRVWLDNSFFLLKEPVINGNMGALTEKIDFNKSLADWKKPDFDDSTWRAGDGLEPVGSGFEMMFGILKTFMMEERPIPLLVEVPGTLTRELGEPVMKEAESVTVRPGQSLTLWFDGETLFNAYFRYRMEGGKGAKISFTYFEKFTRKKKEKPSMEEEHSMEEETSMEEEMSMEEETSMEEEPSMEEVKRDDYIRGEIGDNGQKDSIILNGGTLLYEPFWYRTMRFLKIEIQAADEAVIFCRPELRKTGYPLNPESYVKSDASWVAQVYEMCVRTLQGCMMETYMDCPFWEQMQYPMDTRLQALFTYVCSVDTRLAEKALQDFHDSMLPMGLIQGRTPSNPRQVISTFSLHYIFMILEYYKRTGNKEILKRYRADADMILEYYDRHVGEKGLVENLGYWDFVDWQITWNDSFGRPGAVKEGPSTIINLMYGLALSYAAEINEATGRPGIAQEYRQRQKAITERIQVLCWDESRGLYREGPAYQEFSQHAQSWAVLNGMLSEEDAKVVMGRTFSEKDVLCCYFSTCYELFRACEKAGCYELTRDQMDWWIRLLDEHCTTCPETPYDSRSECHAWSALPMFELISVMAGIRRESANPSRVTVSPHMDYVPNLEGRVITEFGPIAFKYEPVADSMKFEERASTHSRIGMTPELANGSKIEADHCPAKANKGFIYEIILPEHMTGEFTLGGMTRELKAGKNVIQE